MEKLSKSTIARYPFSFIIVVLIWLACMLPIPETSLDNVTLIDKWVHIVMYLALTLTVGFEYYKVHKSSLHKVALVFWAWLLPALMGGLVEIAQAYCTGGRRTGDWLDFAADAIGATLGGLIGILLVKCFAKR